MGGGGIGDVVGSFWVWEVEELEIQWVLLGDGRRSRWRFSGEVWEREDWRISWEFLGVGGGFVRDSVVNFVGWEVEALEIESRFWGMGSGGVGDLVMNCRGWELEALEI